MVMVMMTMGMIGMSDSLHDSVETVDFVGSVFHNTLRAIGFLEGVGSLHHVPIRVFPRILVVPSVEVLNSIFVLVGGWGLLREKKENKRESVKEG